MKQVYFIVLVVVLFFLCREASLCEAEAAGSLRVARMLGSERESSKTDSSDATFEAADKGKLREPQAGSDELPDLVISDMCVDLNEREICLEVCNIGGSGTLEDVQVSFFCYGKRQGRRYREEIGSVTIDELPCGMGNGVTVTVATKTENVYRQLEALVDPSDKIAEKDETNNTAKFKTNKMPPPGYLRLDELDL